MRPRIRVGEPATVATDYLIAAACAYFAFSLAIASTPVEWQLGFALGAVSALAGGTWHGFRELLADRVRSALWAITLLTFGASATAFGAGAIDIAVPQLDLLTLQLGAMTVLGIYAVAALHKPEFATAGRMALLMLGAFTVMAAALAARGAHRPALFALACIVLNVAGVVVQMRKLAPHPRFNHNDLSHVFQLAALWCLYLTVRTAA